jgi:hypothetical protein
LRRNSGKLRTVFHEPLVPPARGLTQSMRGRRPLFRISPGIQSKSWSLSSAALPVYHNMLCLNSHFGIWRPVKADKFSLVNSLTYKE